MRPRVGAHVIGHEVEHLAHVMGVQRRDERLIVRFVTELRIERVVVADVVAVERAWRRLQVGRGIAGAHAERGEVGDERRRVTKCEARMELQAIGARRYARDHALRPLSSSSLRPASGMWSQSGRLLNS